MKLKTVMIFVAALTVAALTVAAYIIAACVPYAGKLRLGEEIQNSFSADNFYGTEISRERVMMLDDSQEAFCHRIEIVSRAQNEIQFATYAMYECTTSDIFMGALLLAADRGIKVSVLTDAKMSAFPSEYKYALTAHENVYFYEYCPANLLNPQYLPVVMHDKYLIIDNSYMIFGGRNVGDKYYDPEGYEGALSFDREVLITLDDPNFEGAIKSTKDYFERETDCSLSERRSSISDRNRKKGENEQTRLKACAEEYLSVIDYSEINYDDLTVPVNKITLITNPIEGTKKEPVVAYNLLMLLQNSQNVTIQSPYTVLTKSNLSYLTDAVNDKDVTLLTNSLTSTPNLPAFSNYYINRDKISEAGLNIYEYQDTKSSIHAKTVLFDDRLTAIGSFNLDERSIRIDTESVLIIDSLEFNAVTQAVLDGYLTQSLKVGADNKYEYNPELDPVKASWFKKAVYTLAGYILTPVKYLL